MPNRFVFLSGRAELDDGDDPCSAKALQTCALRELWEEAGVILAQDRTGWRAPSLTPDRSPGRRPTGLAGRRCGSEPYTLTGLGLTPVFRFSHSTPAESPL
ncbi:hypothetical protein DFAR_4040021 [Desulfarculales bacterium]